MRPGARLLRWTGTGALKRKEGVYNFLLLGSDKGGGNADTIIVASYDTKSQKVGVLSVPRDTMVDRDWSRNGKINAALGHGGPELLAEEITKTLGVPIDYYFHINLQGFVALVDELGGVDVDIPVDMNYDDPYQNLHIHFKKGPQHLDGQAAMERYATAMTTRPPSIPITATWTVPSCNSRCSPGWRTR